MHRPRGAQRSAFVIVILVLAFVLIPSGQSWSGEDTGLPRLPLRHLPAAGAPFVPGRLIVKFRGGPSVQQRATLLNDKGLAMHAHLSLLDAELVETPVGSELAWAARLAENPQVAYVEPDYLSHVLGAPDDAYYASHQWNMPHMNLETAWDTTTGSSAVVIAVVDTGVDATHPDLSSKMVAGYDFVNDDSDASDDEGHGTHVAGIAAATTDNNRGVAGVSWGSLIMPIKVLNRFGTGSHSEIAQGIMWAADHGADIINMSLGGTSTSATLESAIDYAYGLGCLLVAAAGNEYEEGNPTSYPAALDHVMAVGAVGDSDEHADYSNTGSYLDVVAPGGNPTSSWDSDPNHWISSTYWEGSGSSYVMIVGTSQASPHVAGLAALLWSVNASLTNDEVQQIIQDTSEDLGITGWDQTFGWGRVDAAAAVAAAAGSATSTPTATPAASTTATATRTTTSVPTATDTPSPPTATLAATQTPTATSIPAVSHTPTEIPSQTSTATPSATLAPATSTATTTSGPTPTATETSSPTPTRTLAPTRTPTDVPPQPPPAPNNVRVNRDSGSAAQQSPALASALRVFMVWLDDTNGDEQVVSSSLAPGLSWWSRPKRVDDAPEPAALDGARIAAGELGQVVAVWADDRTGKAQIFASRRTIGPGTWSPAERISDVTGSHQTYPDVVIDSQGTEYVVWEDWTAGTNRRGLRWSKHPKGGTWSPSQQVDPRVPRNQRAPSLAVGRGDSVHLVWENPDPSSPSIRWSRLTPGEGAWGVPVTVTDPLGPIVAAPRSPDIAVDGSGTAHVIWQDFRNGDHDPDIFASRLPGGETRWTRDRRVNHDAPGNAQTESALAVTTQGLAYAVWADERNMAPLTVDRDPDIYSATYLPWDSAWVGDTRINDDPREEPALQSSPEITVDEEGNAYVAWTDHRHADTAPDIYASTIEPMSPPQRLYLPFVQG